MKATLSLIFHPKFESMGVKLGIAVHIMEVGVRTTILMKPFKKNVNDTSANFLRTSYLVAVIKVTPFIFIYLYIMLEKSVHVSLLSLQCCCHLLVFVFSMFQSVTKRQ